MLKDLHKLISVILLDDRLTEEEVKSIARICDKSRPKSLIVLPRYLETARKSLVGSGVLPGVIIECHVSLYDVYDKLTLIRKSVEAGAKEVYTMLSPSLYRDRGYIEGERELNLLNSFAKRSGVNVIPIIRTDKFSKNALNKIARLINRYGMEDVVIMSDAKEEDLITLKLGLSPSVHIGILMVGKTLRDAYPYAKAGITRFIVDDMKRFLTYGTGSADRL